jgi:hypothetical protein
MPDLFEVGGDPSRLSRCWLEKYPEHRVTATPFADVEAHGAQEILP